MRLMGSWCSPSSTPPATAVTTSGAATSLAGPRSDEPGHNLAIAAALKEALGALPVFAAGRILTPERAAAAIAAGRADVVAMARPFIADPAWVDKLAQGRVAQIRPCVGANECPMSHGFRSPMTGA